MSILFSPLGESDPIRGYQDGPILHILRNIIDINCAYIFVTKALSKNKDYVIKAIERFCVETNRQVNVEYIDSNIENANDFDIFYDDFIKLIIEIKKKYPNEKICFNISSGTPQMQTTLALIASQEKIGINEVYQVDRPSEIAKDHARVGSEKYNFEDELEYLNMEANAKNRVRIVKLTTIHNNNLRERVKSLVNEFNYQAAYELYKSGGNVEDDILKLLQHMMYRKNLNYQKSKNTLENLSLPINLYKTLFLSNEQSNVSIVLENYLVIDYLFESGQYNDFLVRICAYCEVLQKELIRIYCKYDFNKKFCDRKANKYYYNIESIKGYSEDLYQTLNAKFNGEFKEGLPNLKSINAILEYEVNRNNLNIKPYLVIFDGVESIKHLRDEVAHTLSEVKIDGKDKSIINSCMSKIKELLCEMYNNEKINKNYFNLYKDINKFIIEEMR